MKNIAKIGALSAVLAFMQLPVQAKKPNIILFLVDDMGWQDTSVPFDTVRSAWNDTYRTPNMERLAAKGVKFTSAYASAVSSPSRVSLLTGIDAAAHRVTNWTLRRNESQDTPDDSIAMPVWNMNGLQPIGTDIENSIEANTLPEMLKKGGYSTILCGKAHFGAADTPGADPRNLGFDVNIAGHAAGGLASYLGQNNFGNVVGAMQQSEFAVPGLDKYWGQDIFVTDALTREALHAVDSVRKANKKPFFLYMSHYAVHIPLDADKRYYNQYIAAGLSDSQARYAALIEGMDSSLGDILNYLDSAKIAKNTVVIFISDNGGLSACGRDGTPNSHNTPLSSGKGSAREGGIRVPMIYYNPKMRRQADVQTSPVAIMDLMPTVLDIARLGKRKTWQTINGININPLLKGESIPDRNLYWHYPNKWGCSGEGIGTYSAIRKGDFKFIYYYNTKSAELYNIETDMAEKDNLAGKPEFQTLRAELAAELTAYLKSRSAQLPFNKSTGEECEYPH